MLISPKARFHGITRFSRAQFKETANYNNAEFMSGTEFSHCEFIQEVTFIETVFSLPSRFNYVLFRDPENVNFQTNNLSQVSFVNTDISRVKFGENVKWGFVESRGQRDKNEFKILEEREIEAHLKNYEKVQVELGNIIAVYRSLRENYEYRLRYDEAGEFFIRELEMKRLYKQDIRNGQSQIRRNNLIIRNLSLTGLYYHLSRYGESFSRPTLFGIGIILFSTVLWLTQPNPAANFSIHDMTIPQIVMIPENITTPENVTIPEMNNITTNLEIAFERSLTNFLPSLSFGTELNVGLLDVAFKIVGGAVTFGLIIIALRRKFERKFRH